MSRVSGLDKQVKKCRDRNAVLNEIVNAGPVIRSTSIGRVMYDPRTCTCTVKGRTDRDHAEDCTVEPVVDSGPVVAALRELRLNQAFLLSLEEDNTVVDTSQLDEIVSKYEGMWHQITALTSERDELRRQLDLYETSVPAYVVPELESGHDLAHDLASAGKTAGTDAAELPLYGWDSDAGSPNGQRRRY